MFIFLLLSLLSGVLEIGIILWGYAAEMPLWVVLVLGAMYQLGNLLFVPGKLGRLQICILGTCCLCFGMVNPRGEYIFLTAAQIVLASLCIQAMRARQKGSCPTWLKRLFRIGGFLLAPLMVGYFGEVMLVCILVPLCAALAVGDKGDVASKVQAAGKGLSATMIFHQMHYFVYTYVMLAAVLELVQNSWLCVALFALTWGIYLLPGLVADKAGRYHPVTLFFVCHGFLAACMGMLTAAFLTGNIILGLCAWMLTGLGGGSVFCIRCLTKREASCNMTLSENIGHFLGALVSAAVACAAGEGVYAVAAALSCLFVCVTLGCAASGIRKERRS